MGRLFNMIITNDLLFYGIIVFLIIGLVILFMYLHHRKVIELLEEEIEYNKIEDEKINDSLNNLAEVSNLKQEKIELDEKINILTEKFNEIDGKSAIEKILNEDISTNHESEIYEENINSMKTYDDVVMHEKNKEEQIASRNERIDDLDYIEQPKFIKTTKQSEEQKFEEQEIEESENNTEPATVNEKKSELELVLEQMQKDLEEQKDKDAVAIFEQEQEEKSIISYKELLEKKNELLSMTSDERFENEAPIVDNEPTNYDDILDNKLLTIEQKEPEIEIPKFENNSTISDSKKIVLPNDIIQTIDKIDNETNTEKTKEENTQHKKFVTTDFISPVFGRMEAQLDYPKVPNFKELMTKQQKTNEYNLETTLNLEPLTEQIKKDDAFLNALKEFRKNLE